MKPRFPYQFLQRITYVALIFELGNRQQPRGRAGIAGNDYEFLVLRASRRPFEIIRRADRFSVLVDPHKRHIKIVSRKYEIVEVAAEGRYLLLGRKNYADVGVFFEPV